MDETDIEISKMLLMNSRVPYREIAEALKLSINSVHKRIKNMMESGIIQKFVTKLGAGHITFINLMLFGNSGVKDIEKGISDLGINENIYNVTHSSGNLIFIHAQIRDINELDTLVSFVRMVGKIDELTVGICKFDIPCDLRELNLDNIVLSKLDYQIIESLRENSRKLISEIAEEIGTSTKTIRRHLDRLIKNLILQFSIDWYPDKSNDIFSMLRIQLNPKRQRENEILLEDFRRQYGQRIVYIWQFSNLPNLIVICVWTNTMKELQNITSSLTSEDYESVNVNVLVSGKNFPTWQDTYLDTKIKEFRET
ncbi:MAG TPA: winged helix-turn-helix transcriptional regulator [Candidatus Deferrimicrobium sp.]|nr:winged helix-turn-helix transcriptional regulator [Candidatus Deferrimicrobium sp.]